MKILFLSSWFPFPPNNGSKLRIYNLLRGLAEHHQIKLLSFADEADTGVPTDALRSFCHEIEVISAKLFMPKSWRSQKGFFSLTPRSVLDTYSPDMEHVIQQTLASQEYNFVIASQLAAANYAPQFQGVSALFEEVELGVIYEQYTRANSVSRRLRHGLTWLKHKRYLVQLLRRFQACTVASKREQQLVAHTVPGYEGIEVIPNCVRVADYVDIDRTPQPNRLIYTGSFRYFANYEAVTWFLREVFPTIQAQVPNIEMTITGDHANLPLPSVEGVRQTGHVHDVRPLIAEAWCSVAPILSGGGTRLKILEAMALGTPVVATSKGAEGLDAEHNVHLLIADSPLEFAESVVRLCTTPGLRRQLADNAYQLVCEHYDWTVTMPRFLALIEQTEHKGSRAY